MAPSPRQSTAQGPAQGVSGPQGIPGSPPLTWRSRRRLPAAARMGRAGTTLAVNFGCVNFLGGGGGWLRDCSEGSWAPPESTLPKTMGGRPTEELR